MATIDADAHVVESEHTWNDMDPTERKYRPILVSPHGASEERPVQSILDTGGWRTSGSRGAQQGPLDVCAAVAEHAGRAGPAALVQGQRCRRQQFSFWRSTGIELWWELKPLDHEIHQVMPTVKDHITCQGLDILKKRLAPGKHATKQGIFRDYSIFTGFWYGSRGACVVECWPQHASKEDTAMCGPGAYRPDPTEGMTAIADLPPPEIVPSSRTYTR